MSQEQRVNQHRWCPLQEAPDHDGQRRVPVTRPHSRHNKGRNRAQSLSKRNRREEFNTSTPPASLRQGLMAPARLKCGHGPWTEWGTAQVRLGSNSQPVSASTVDTVASRV